MPWKRGVSERLYRRIYSHALLVSGPARSGTTILLRLVGAHPRVLGVEAEAHAMTDFARIAAAHSTGPEAAYRQSCLALPVEEFERRLAALAFESFAGRLVRGGPLHKLRRTASEGAWPRDRAITHWCAKTKATRTAIQGFQNMFPNVRYVHIVRNGVDTVYSRMRYPGFSHLSFGAQCEAWCGEISYYRTLREADGVLIVRHEDLTCRVEETVGRILDFCGLEWEDAPLECVTKKYVHPLDEETRDVESVAEEIRSRKPVWDKWDDDRRKTFRQICGASMEELGYGLPPIS